MWEPGPAVACLGGVRDVLIVCALKDTAEAIETPPTCVFMTSARRLWSRPSDACRSCGHG